MVFLFCRKRILRRDGLLESCLLRQNWIGAENRRGSMPTAGGRDRHSRNKSEVRVFEESAEPEIYEGYEEIEVVVHDVLESIASSSTKIEFRRSFTFDLNALDDECLAEQLQSLEEFTSNEHDKVAKCFIIKYTLLNLHLCFRLKFVPRFYYVIIIVYLMFFLWN